MIRPNVRLMGMAVPVGVGAYGGNSDAVARVGRDGSPRVVLAYKALGALDEGSYYLARTPTPGTGIAPSTATTDAITTTCVLVENVSVGEQHARRVYLDYVRLIVASAATTLVAVRWALRTDGRLRWSSGGTVLAPVCTSMTSPTATAAVVRFGTVTVTAGLSTSGLRLVNCGLLATAGIPGVGQTFTWTFGASEGVLSDGDPTLVAPSSVAIVAPQCALGPNQSLLLSLWSGSAIGGTCEVEVGWIER